MNSVNHFINTIFYFINCFYIKFNLLNLPKDYIKLSVDELFEAESLNTPILIFFYSIIVS